MRPVLTDLERDLVTAALAQDGRAAQAFDRVMATLDFAGPVDGGHFRMLPLMYTNLTRAGIPAARLGMVRGVYKYNWCRSHQIAARASEAVSAVAAAGAPVMMCKGIVLAKRYYDSPAQRPMSDVDLVVPVDRVRDAARALERIGYGCGKDFAAMDEARYQDYIALRHSVALSRGGDQIDLHWYVMRSCRSAAANRRFWTNAESFEIAPGVAARQLRAGDMLLHVVLHGLQWNAMSPLRWIADAAMILRRAGRTIDWDELFDAAAALRTESHFRAGLEFLRSLDLVDLPHWPRRPRTTLIERAERWAHGDARILSVPVSVLRWPVSDARPRIPRLATRWAARRLGAI